LNDPCMPSTASGRGIFSGYGLASGITHPAVYNRRGLDLATIKR
jgi:hypothetical protein